jgi:ribosomal-protein-alanine acetyltransferase
MGELPRIELARRSDAPTLGRMSRVLIEAGLPWRWTPAAIEAQIVHPETEVIVARCGETIAGFALMSFGEDEAHLLLLAVDPRLRRRGLGRMMIRWLEAEARTAGLRAVTLEVRAHNQLAREFYRRLGYHEVERLPAYYHGREDALRLRSQLRVEA